MLRDLWANRRGLVFGVGAVILLVVVTAVYAVATGAVGGADATSTSAPEKVPGAGMSSPVPGTTLMRGDSTQGEAGGEVPPPGDGTGYQAGRWDLLPDPASGAVSAAYPAMSDAARTQQDLFAKEFAAILFTRDYANSTRGELLSWAQAVVAPLTIDQVALSDTARVKILGQSLTMPDFDSDQTEPVIPGGAEWDRLAAEGAHTTVADVKVQTVPASQFPPANTTFSLPTFDRLVTATVTLHRTVDGAEVTSGTSVAFEVLMTLDKGQLGAAEVQHYVVREIG